MIRPMKTDDQTQMSLTMTGNDQNDVHVAVSRYCNDYLVVEHYPHAADLWDRRRAWRHPDRLRQ
jgi:hypothetical protein